MREDYKTEEIKDFLIATYKVRGIKRINRFESGIDNSNFHVEAEKDYVFRVIELVPIESVRYEVAFLKYCKSKRLPVQKVFRAGKSEVLYFQNKPCILLEYLKGEMIEKVKLTETLLADVGKVTAQFDKRASDFQYKIKIREHFWDSRQFLLNERFLRNVKNSDKKLVADVLADFRRIIPRLEKCRRGVIHNDIRESNVLVRKEKVKGVIDFGDTIYTAIVADVAIPLSMICFLGKKPLELSRAFLKSYNKIFALTDVEKQILYSLVRVRFATAILYCSYWNDTAGRHPDYNALIEWGKSNLLKINDIGKEKYEKVTGLFLK